MSSNFTKTQYKCKQCATSRQVAGSIPDGVIEIFHWLNLAGRTMTMGSTQPLMQMSTRRFFLGVKAARVYRWQTSYLNVPTV